MHMRTTNLVVIIAWDCEGTYFSSKLYLINIQAETTAKNMSWSITINWKEIIHGFYNENP